MTPMVQGSNPGVESAVQLCPFLVAAYRPNLQLMYHSASESILATRIAKRLHNRAPRLLMGTEARVMTPGGIELSFLFFLTQRRSARVWVAQGR